MKITPVTTVTSYNMEVTKIELIAFKQVLERAINTIYAPYDIDKYRSLHQTIVNALCM